MAAESDTSSPSPISEIQAERVLEEVSVILRLGFDFLHRFHPSV